MFENLLVCLDGSPLAEQILPYVEAQVKCFQNNVTLLQVVVVKEPEIVGSGATYKEFSEVEIKRQEHLKTAWAYLSGMADGLNDKGIKTTVAVVQASSAGEAIVEYAKKNGAGLIAMASHGRSGLREVMLGSVAEYVFKNSGLPVLMIRVKKA
jgi:nucleotide-binding universal stress UspA family protein